MPTARIEGGLAPAASAGGTVEHIGYSARAGAEPVYVVLHLPRRPVGAVVVCGSIGWESAKNYRREVLLGRELAARGLATVRFHYRGLGESGGSFEHTTLASMTEDARRARVLLSRRTGFLRPGLVGIRTGALVAAALSDELGPVPVAFWDPVVSGADYLRELTQIRRVWQVTHGVAGSAADAGAGARADASAGASRDGGGEVGTDARAGGDGGTRVSAADVGGEVGTGAGGDGGGSADVGGEVATGGRAGAADVGGDVDDGRAGAALGVLGYRLSGAFVTELREARLGEWAQGSSSPVLSLHVGAIPRSARALWPVADDAPACVESVPGRIDWWMKRPSFEPEETSPVTTALVGRTVDWLASHTGTEAGPALSASAISPTATIGGVRRQVVRVGAGDDQLMGVFVGPPDSGDPALAAVILNCGGYHSTSGPAGLWALLADLLAKLGVPSLRVAYRGVADSTGAVSDFDLTQPRSEELRAARTWLTEAGFPRHVLLGGCLGARTCCAADLPGVAGLGLVSLPWHRESLGTGTDSRKSDAAPEEPASWVNTSLLTDLRRCTDAGVPLRIVYGETERYRRDLQAAAESGALGPALEHRLGLRSLPAADSMFEPQAVSTELADFVAGLLSRS